MHQRQGRFEARVLEVPVIGADLIREQHPLVGDGARGHGRDVVRRLGVARRTDGVVHALAHHEELALEGVLVRAVVPAGDEDLPGHGLRGQDALPQDAVVHRDIAPAQHLLAALDEVALDGLDHLLAAGRVLGQEDHADAVAPHRGQLEAHLGAEEGVGDLHQDARPVAGPGVGAHGPAVGQADQQLEALLDDTPALDVLDVADEPDATGVVLIGRVVQPVGFG